jgi:hypothetical protein
MNYAIGNTNIIHGKRPIFNGKDLVDIDGKGSDVDLTHWDVSHVSNANKAFVNELKTTVIATLECFPPKLGVTIIVY